MRKRSIFAALAACIIPLLGHAAPEPGFTSLFDGKTFEGWKVNENESSFTIEDGAIKANGDRSHCFYVGGDNKGVFKNFELRLDVMTRKSANGGVYIHVKYLDQGWPIEKGYEIQVNNTQSDPQKSGGIYNTVRNEKPFKDDEWMEYVITVKRDRVKVKINGKEIADYTEEKGKERLLEEGGLIAFQAHDPGSTVYYKNIRIKELK